VQRFYPIVDAPEGTLPDYAIASRVRQQIARMNLDIHAPSQVFMALAAHTPDYAGLTYQKLSQSAEQWPIIGRKDLYYGGTSYDNHQGLGVKLTSAAERGQRMEFPEVDPAGTAFNNDSLVGYPITLSYDRGTTVMPSTLLAERLPEPFIVLHPETISQLNLTAGLPASLHMKGQTYKVKIREDESVPVNTVLTPRSLGLPALEPVVVQVTKSQRG
jgi:NADH-quinone oxidoreductase subunit G